MVIDENLKQFATERQAECIDAVNAHGGLRAAGRHLGISHKNVFKAVKSVEKMAAMRGYSPKHDFTRPVPDMFVAKGVSTYYNKDGKPTGQWVKASLDDQKRIQAMQDAIAALCDDVPRVNAAPAPAISSDSLATVYTLTDSHVGMLSWHRETGEDWDLEIAERVLTGCFQAMIDASPAAGIGIGRPHRGFHQGQRFQCGGWIGRPVQHVANPDDHRCAVGWQ
jgi:hypothetical protein